MKFILVKHITKWKYLSEEVQTFGNHCLIEDEDGVRLSCLTNTHAHNTPWLSLPSIYNIPLFITGF